MKTKGLLTSERIGVLKQKSPTISSKTFCEPDRIRTYDRLLRREVLYPAELRARNSNFFLCLSSEKQSRSGRIRTCDLRVPNAAR